MDGGLTVEDLSAEAGVPVEALAWMTEIGVLKPDEAGRFGAGDAFRAKMIGALLRAGFPREQIEWGVADGSLALGHVAHYVLVEPAPRAGRTFAEFSAAQGRRGSVLPAVYQTLGLPVPDPAAPIRVDEERILERFLEGWSPASDDETLIRAARLIGEGTRLAALGWPGLLRETVAGPASDRYLRGEVDRYPPEVIHASTVLVALIPRVMAWLTQRYLEELITAGIVEGFEAVLASRGLAPAPEPTAPPAVLFVDLAGFTRVTEEEGDAAAVRLAASLQSRAEAAAQRHDGRLIKLLGDGAMLHFPAPESGLEAGLELVRVLGEDLGVAAHAGVNVGPVVERDRDLFGRTVNMASRIAGTAAPGEVRVSAAVVEAATDAKDRFDFEPLGDVSLKGFAEPVPVFRVTRT
jgi:adenylate cyclase